MKKTIIAALAVATLGVAGANAQTVQAPSFGDNWSVGVEGGVTTPMSQNPFFGSMRPMVGIHVGKQLTPVFGMGVEGDFSVNTNWKNAPHSGTAFDRSYVGLYGNVDLFNLFGGYQCAVRPFTIEATAGAGWGHYYGTKHDVGTPYNYMAAKTGLNFNFNVNEHLTVAVKPSIIWNLNREVPGTSQGFNINRATFNVTAGVTYNFGPGFVCVQPYNQAEVDDLNAQVNELRGALTASVAAGSMLQGQVAALSADLQACQSRKPEVVVEKEVSNIYNSVRFVFFRVGSANITTDQLPNVEMIADYMKSHPKSKVVIKGYASPEGNYDFNMKLAKNRAESVKSSLVNRFKIAADRITAEGEGIGNMFEEPSWNRVSVCTLESE